MFGKEMTTMAIKGGNMSKSSPGALTWFKNVSKSLGYTSTQLVKDMTPSIGEFFLIMPDSFARFGL